MNSAKSIWSEEPMTTGIAVFVCYAGVFNDVIGVEEMASRLGVEGQDKFYAALEELRQNDRIVVKDGFAGLPGFEEKIAAKISKIAFTKKLIDSRMKDLRRIGRNPLIKFVGISGSLAADNPTRDKNGRLDLDVFLITRKQCLWVYNIIRGIRYLFPRSRFEPELCINYVMDESNLTVPNRNFYTATEIRNLIPVSGWNAYRKFLRANGWAGCFYPGMADLASPASPVATGGGLIDQLFYFVYTVLRCVKWLSVEPLRKIIFKPGPFVGVSAGTFRPTCGGYHPLVQRKFGRLAETWYPDLIGGVLIEKMFPDELSAEVRCGKLDVEALAQATIGDAYSKYG